MSILKRLFGSKNRSSMTGDQSLTVRNLLKARTPPWHRVEPIVIDAIFEALDDTELFDCFVMTSMENGLVPKYESLGRDGSVATVVRAQISQILCQFGFRELTPLVKALNAKQTDAVAKIAFSITNSFESAIALANDQLGAYMGMAELFALFDNGAESGVYAKRGLFELDKIQQDASLAQAYRKSSVFPPDFLEQVERQLRGYLE